MGRSVVRNYEKHHLTILIMNMKIIFLGLAIAATAVVAKAQVEIPYQEIPYNVNYHWGVIDVNIARGRVTMESNGTSFRGTLDGTSIPWEGKIICVSDTLSADVYSYGGAVRETVRYQSGWYRHVPVSLFRSGSYNPDDPAYFKNIAGQGNYDASHASMEAITVTSDMIGMYFFSHTTDFSVMRPGEQVRIGIEGGYSNELVITYNGQGTYTVNGDTYPTYDCTFEYSYGGGMSGYPVECKIGANNHIPLFLSASLPVGRVEMLYDPY